MYILIAFITLTTHYYIPHQIQAKQQTDVNKTVVIQEFNSRTQCEEILSLIRSNTKAEGRCIEKRN
jgi:hypothetical protein